MVCTESVRPFSGGFQKDDFAKGKVAFLSSVVPGSGPAGTGPKGKKNDPTVVGDNPDNPRDPDRLLDTSPDDPDRGMVLNDDHKEKRLRFIPSGLANEILLDVYVRVASFEPYEGHGATVIPRLCERGGAD